ncbi:MAG: 3-methyl-2-oxobutanoate hydroxymethyltransferase [Firmicutes bacterium]|nr:3-methyl-2-oxobutanoate hydroxymethyltransferase [Bacillota bacterium]
MTQERVTVKTFQEMKIRHETITMLTAYDYPTARLVDANGVDGILVGDSVGNVVLGYDSTLPVTMDEMIHHVRAVARGTARALVVADMPFMSYQVSVEEAVRSAGRFLKEAGAQAVKLEGGANFAPTVKAIVRAGIPVMGHIGLTPQSVNQLGGYKVQGKDLETATRLVHDAKAIEKAGAFAIVLECVPRELAEIITQSLTIPTIGIGAGAACDGQILVIHDLLGVSEKGTPKFVKCYAELHQIITDAIGAFVHEVRAGKFPGREHSFTIPPETLGIVREIMAGADVEKDRERYREV